MALFIAIDFGTSNVKAAVVNEEGKVLFVAQQPISLQQPHPGWVEQDPDEWVKAGEKAVREVVECSRLQVNEVAAVGICGQMHTLVLLDANGWPLRPAINWADRRSIAQVQLLAGKCGVLLEQRIGNRAVTGFTAPSLMWVRDNEPEVFRRAVKLCLPKDYVRFRWIGTICTDVSDASGTLLFNVQKRSWDRELIAELEIPPDLLPPVRESPEVAGYLSKEAAGRLGLLAGIPVIVGAGDTLAAALGSGLTNAGRTMVTIGSGGQVYTVTNQPCFDRPQLRVHTVCHCLPGKWGVLGATLTAGLALNWYARLFGQIPLKELEEEARDVPPGAEGLFFLPLLSGERTPHMDPRARGAFVGLTLHHERAHMTRAVMEGVSFSLKSAVDVVESLAGTRAPLVVGGGGTQSPLWRQLLVDILGRKALVPDHHERAVTGAALLAAVGVGLESSIESFVERLQQSGTLLQPRPQESDIYAQLYRTYRRLYPSLTTVFAETGEFA